MDMNIVVFPTVAEATLINTFPRYHLSIGMKHQFHFTLAFGD